MPTDIDTLFSFSSNIALGGWLILALAPRRWNWVLLLAGVIIPGILAALYGALMLTHFANIDGGGFGSLNEVKALFANDAVLLAGWIHYLAFDLAIGAVIARRADAAGISRLIQVPILFLTLMFGPLGFLLYVLTETGWRAVGGVKAGAAQ